MGVWVCALARLFLATYPHLDSLLRNISCSGDGSVAILIPRVDVKCLTLNCWLQVKEILQEEEDLSEIVQLVGKVSGVIDEKGSSAH